MSGNSINFEDKKIKISDFYKNKNKKIFNIDGIDVNKILVSKKVSYGKNNSFKVGLSPSPPKVFICFNGSPSKMIKNAFYFVLKALFVLKIFKFLS